MLLERVTWVASSLLGLVLLAFGSFGVSSAAELKSLHAQNLLVESMDFMDKIYDRDAGYLYYFYYPLAAGQHETRSSMWYATGLLQRNRGDDVDQAVRIIKNIIGDQEKNETLQWFGDYTVYPEQPTVGHGDYKPVIYSSWDPNWRGFIGTNLIVIYEEFGALLPGDVKQLILSSLYNATVGDSYRVGGVDDDNLYPSYSNPAIMRAVASGWTGRQCGDANMTAAGETYAREVLDLFDRNQTLSEFNSGTYMGVSLYGLTLWAKYMPASGSDPSVMGVHGARMIRQIWETAGKMYNANLGNLAGPWDRAYGYDMNKYVSIFSLYIWTLVGKESTPGLSSGQTWSMAHADDFEYAPLIAVLAPFHDALVPKDTVARLTAFSSLEGDGRDDEHTYMHTASAFSPPHDLAARNITTWLSPELTIGAESFRESIVGGPREDSSQWNPAVVQWAHSSRSATHPSSNSNSEKKKKSVGYLTLYPTEPALDAEVMPGNLNLTYPNGNATSSFTFLVSANPLGSAKRDLASLEEDLDGVKIGVSGSVHPVPIISFCGLVGGSCKPIHGFEFWNFTYVMPANSTAVPNINLAINAE
ncbi:hypothetical protein PG999_003428 [Apiospora kogelbergensis]|uniref:Uncharacterized protein n=1 Tax=Apiospora kogelbergensis TaxID=1337665 RepID=A0AAW0R3G4_9PEZI